MDGQFAMQIPKRVLTEVGQNGRGACYRNNFLSQYTLQGRWKPLLFTYFTK